TVTDTENHFTPVTRDLVVRARDDSEGVNAGAAPPGPVNVQFFPEGGRLVAGLVNRVYFSAHTPLGLPVDLEGRIVDAHDGEAPVVRTAAQATDSLSRGFGVFSFIPAWGQAAKLRVTSPAGVPDIALPLAQAGGIVLTIPDAVAQQGDTLPILLQSTGNDERRLVVAISCRGSLVGERIVTAGPGSTRALIKLG